ncbi:MAG: PAS domain-containing protein [Chloroflexi bacterium]|nr:PAS domain-containing protein [Chloroflexota bacterium]
MTPNEPGFETHTYTKQLVKTIHASERYAYAALSKGQIIQFASPNLGTILQLQDIDGFIGKPVTHLLGELVGAESAFANILAGKQPLYQLENVARKQSDNQFTYITIQVVLLNAKKPEAGFLLSIENSTEVGRLQQTLTQQRNELKHEITRREKAEQELQRLNDVLEQRVQERTAELAKANEQLRLLEAAIVNTSDTVIITQSQPKSLAQAGIVYVNKAFTKATGYTYKEIVGQSRQVFHGPNTDPRQLERIRNALINREAVHVELINYRKDGTEFWADMTVAPILNEDNELTHFVSIERDATERKQLENALLQAQKMEAIGLLAGGIAHDFNNVLTIIISYSDLLLRLFQTNQKVMKYVKPINTAGKRASDLTHQLLAFSRQQVLQLEDVDANEIIAEVEMMIRRPIGEDIQFTTVLAPDLWHIEADPGQLSQVIMNLSVNARDAMPKGGNLTITTENVTLTQRDNRISPELETGEYIRLTVRDTGNGMDKKLLRRIFDPFFTTKELGKGTGLGLSSVYGIIAQSKGGILVESEVGTGTAFEIFLPRSFKPNIENYDPQVSLHPRTKGSGRILLVEDDQDVRNLIYEGLVDHGYQVLVATNGVEALRICESESNPLHLLLTDVVMPEMSGHELAEKIQAIQPTIKTLYITGYTDSVIINHGIQDGAVALLQKPFTIGQLTIKIHQILANLD